MPSGGRGFGAPSSPASNAASPTWSVRTPTTSVMPRRIGNRQCGSWRCHGRSVARSWDACRRWRRHRFRQFRSRRFFWRRLKQFQNAFHERKRFSRRHWEACPRHRKRPVEILAIEPVVGTHPLGKTVVPYPGDVDVECAPALLIDRLNSSAGDRPLSAHPIDVAMHGHRYTFFLKALSERDKQG